MNETSFYASFRLLGCRLVHGFSVALLAAFLSIPAAVADTVFSDTTPGLFNGLTLPAGTYQIIATGAAGGNGVGTAGGRGAVIGGTFTFSATETLNGLVGGKGGDGDGSGGGGGGATFVLGPDGALLIIAGGGGGGGSDRVYNGGNATGIAASGGGGGTGGGGDPVSGPGGGGGGGGLTGNGETGYGAYPGGQGGFSFRNGGAGGAGGKLAGTNHGIGGNGGIGSGAGGGAVMGGGGGGGGYTGGAGGYGAESPLGPGFGGSSFNAGSDAKFSLATSPGNGSVVINSLQSEPPPPQVPEPAGLTVLGAGLLGLSAILTRVRQRQRKHSSTRCTFASLSDRNR